MLDLVCEVPTPHGMVTVGELAPGTQVFGSEGRPVPVLEISEVIVDRPCLGIGFSTGEQLVVGDGQQLLTERRDLPLSAAGAVRRSAAEVADGVASYGRNTFAVRVAHAVQLPQRRLPVPPYLLGVWLGAGIPDQPAIRGADGDLAQALTGAGVRVFTSGIDGLHWIGAPGDAKRGADLRTLLRTLRLLGDKHVPMLYLRSSEEQRRDLLAGLLDSAAVVTSGGEIRFRSSTATLARGVHQLIASLGYRPWTSPVGMRTEVGFVTGTRVFRRESLQAQVQHRRRPYIDLRPRRLVTSVAPVPSRPVRHVRVAADDGLFLVGGSFIPVPGVRA